MSILDSIFPYLFLEPSQERGGHGGQAGERLAKLDGSLHQVAEKRHRYAVHVGDCRAVQLDAPVVEKRNYILQDTDGLLSDACPQARFTGWHGWLQALPRVLLKWLERAPGLG